MAAVDLTSAARRATLAALDRPLAANDRLSNWLDTALGQLVAFFGAFGVRFEGSTHDMPERMGPIIREALRSANVPAPARQFLAGYVDAGANGIPFSAAVRDFRTVSRSPEREFDELVRIFDVRQSRNQNLAAFVDRLTLLTTPVAGYQLPSEVQGILLLRGLADPAVRMMALRLMADGQRESLAERLKLPHVVGIVSRAELMVPSPSPARAAPAVQRGGHSQRSRGRGRGRGHGDGNGNGTGDDAGNGDRGPASGANAIAANARQCYNCRQYGHVSANCRNVVMASLSTGSPIRALLDGNRPAMFIVEGTIADVKSRILLDSGAGMNLMSSCLASKLPEDTVEQLPAQDVTRLVDASGRPMGSVARVALEQPVVVHEFETLLSFGVSEEMGSGLYDVILGAPFFRAHAVNFVYEQDTVVARGRSLGQLVPLSVS